MKAVQLAWDAQVNGGLAAPPACFVCSKVARAATLEEQMEARRALNMMVWILSPGVSLRHPLGLVRHSYCAPGTPRWARNLDPQNAGDVEWARRFGLEAGQ